MVSVVPERDLNLDRISLDGFAVRRRSATLHFGGGDRPETRDSPWWVYLGCEPIPTRYDVSPHPMWLGASTISGRPIRAQARIVARHDDGYGTELILAGLGSLVA